MNIFVGNLSFDTTEEDLRTAFSAFGEIKSINILKDKFTNQPRGFGFVEMMTDAESKAAIEGLHGKTIGGRTINVSEARPREERPAGGGNRGSGGFGGGNSGGGNRNRSW
jgi:cold-inducible RNA-binding protein